MTEADAAVVRSLAADETEALVRCFERCYGASYVDASFQDAALLRERVEKGRLRSVVAVAPDGEIVGHMGLSLRREGDTTVDAGNTVVDPRFRKQQLAARLGLALSQRCRDEGFTAFHHYPTTAHPAVQKLAVRGGGIETGVMLDYIPATTRYRELDGAPGGPWSAVVVYQPIAKAPGRRVFLPERYAPLLGELYAKTGLERRLEAADREPAAAATRLELHDEERRSLLRIHVARAGRDLAVALETAMAAPPREIVQVDLPLGDATGQAAIDALRALGFGYCACLPDYHDGDVLRLQRHAHLQDLAPEVATDDARRLLAFIAADRP